MLEGNDKAIAADYQEFAKITKDPVAAAILTLVSRLPSTINVKLSADVTEGSLSHELSLGIRHGLFGWNCDDDRDVTRLTLDGEVAVTQPTD